MLSARLHMAKHMAKRRSLTLQNLQTIPNTTQQIGITKCKHVYMVTVGIRRECIAPLMLCGLNVIGIAPALKCPVVPPALRPIHPWIARGSGELSVFCVKNWTVICFATEKNIREKKKPLTRC